MPRAIREQMTYLMFNFRNRYTKIGKSVDPGFREKTLHAEDPDIHVLAISWDEGERDLHKTYARKRLRGEWFDLDLQTIEGLLLDKRFYLADGAEDVLCRLFGVRSLEVLDLRREQARAAECVAYMAGVLTGECV